MRCEGPPYRRTWLQKAPGSNDYTVYDAPGVPHQSSNANTSQNNTPGTNNTAVVNNAPGTNYNSNSGGGVVVSGPPGSVVTEKTSIPMPNPNINSSNNVDGGDVVPILGPPQ